MVVGSRKAIKKGEDVVAGFSGDLREKSTRDTKEEQKKKDISFEYLKIEVSKSLEENREKE